MSQQSVALLDSETVDDVRVSILTDSDRMHAWLKLESPGSATAVTLEDVLALVRRRGFLSSDDLVDRVQSALDDIRQTPDGVALIDLAQGRPPTPGCDGRVNWKVKPFIKDKTLWEQWEVDPARPNRLQGTTIVASSDVIATIDQPTPGQDGLDVFGQMVETAPGREVTLQAGQGVLHDQARDALVAEVPGRVVLDGQTVFIEPVLVVAGEVGYGTGNIDFDGPVIIRGGVQAGFEVHARGPVEVRGNVAAATIDCSGDLFVQGGVNGRGKAVLRCSGSLKARYLSGVRVEAGESVEVHGSITRCQLKAGGDVRVETGGVTASHVSCRGDLHSPVIRSSKRNDTIIEVGVDETIPIKRHQLRGELIEQKKKRDSCRFRLGGLVKEPERINEFDPKRRRVLGQRLEHYFALVRRCEKLSQDLEDLTTQSRLLIRARLCVWRRITRGVVVRIGRCQTSLRRDEVGPVELSAQLKTFSIAFTRG